MALFKMRYEENSFTVSYKGDLITLDPDANSFYRYSLRKYGMTK